MAGGAPALIALAAALLLPCCASLRSPLSSPQLSHPGVLQHVEPQIAGG